MLQAAYSFIPCILTAPSARSVATIRAIGREAWNACHPRELEDYDYLLALEDAGIAGFSRHYLIVEDEGRVLACMPAFFTDYNLATTLEGAIKRVIVSLQRLWPDFLIFKLACLGAPETECGKAGFHPEVTDEQKPDLLRLMLTHFTEEAPLQGYSLIGIKDVPTEQQSLWEQVTQASAFNQVPGLPTAKLAIDFNSIDHYLARLSKVTRKDMRRKLKEGKDIRVEYRNRIDDVLPQIIALYRSTRERNELQFEELTEAYFAGVLKNMGTRAHCVLYYHGERLLAANLMLKDRHTLLDKFFCMDSAAGRDYSLYFLSWFTNVRYCIEHGMSCYQSGQEGYEAKLRLGSTLHANSILFKHLHPLANYGLRLVSPLLALGEDT